MSGLPKLPTPLERREILYGGETSEGRLEQYGHAYLQEGLVNDAVEFFGVAGSEKGLALVRRFAVEEGDFFLLSRVVEFAPEAASAEVWRELAERAYQRGKLQFAQKAFEKSGDGQQSAEVRKAIAEHRETREGQN